MTGCPYAVGDTLRVLGQGSEGWYLVRIVAIQPAKDGVYAMSTEVVADPPWYVAPRPPREGEAR